MREICKADYTASLARERKIVFNIMKGYNQNFQGSFLGPLQTLLTTESSAKIGRSKMLNEFTYKGSASDHLFFHYMLPTHKTQVSYPSTIWEELSM